MKKYTSDYMIEYELQSLTPEGVLSGWIGNSLILLTAAMVFFHICQQKSLKAKGSLPAYIAVSLIIVSIMVCFFSLRVYSARIDQLIKSCNEDPKCPKEHINVFTEMRYRNISLGVILTIIECLVATLILYSL